MATAEQVISRNTAHYAPDRRRNERATVICIDERAALLKGLHLTASGRSGHYTTLDRRTPSHSNGLYLRTAGGAAGVGKDLHITMRMLQARNNKQSRFDVNPALKRANARQAARQERPAKPVPPAHLLGSAVAKVAAIVGIDLCNHVGCAAEANALPIGQGLAANRGNKGQNIQKVVAPHWRGPGDFDEIFAEIQEAYAEGVGQDMIAPAEVSVPLFDNGNLHEGGTVRAVPRPPLAPMPHVSNTLIIDHRAGVVIDAVAGTEQTLATGSQEVWTHYCYNTQAAEMLGGAIVDHLLDVDRGEFMEAFHAAAFVRNAATSLWLPEQQGQAPEIYTLAA